LWGWWGWWGGVVGVLTFVFEAVGEVHGAAIQDFNDFPARRLLRLACCRPVRVLVVVVVHGCCCRGGERSLGRGHGRASAVAPPSPPSFSAPSIS